MKCNFVAFGEQNKKEDACNASYSLEVKGGGDLQQQKTLLLKNN